MKKQRLDVLFNLVNYVALFLLGAGTFYPLYYVFIYSLSDPSQAIGGVYLLPKGFTFINYIEIFKKGDLLQASFISVARTILGTMLTLMGCTLFAYGLTQKRLPFRKIIFKLTIVTMYFSVGLIPWYLTMKAYGLQNNFLLYILPSIISPFYLLLIKTFYEQLPPALEESAMIDGAGPFRVFIRIILPLSVPIIATIAIFAAVGQWNAWTDNLYLNSRPNLRTLQYTLYNYLNQMSAFEIINTAKSKRATVRLTPSSVRMTITVIVTLPIFLVYPFLQKYFLKGILLGAVKG